MGINFSKRNKGKRVIRTRAQLDEEINLFLTFNNETPKALSIHDQLISCFLEVAVGQTVETAKRLLETTKWNIEESINLFLLDETSDDSARFDDGDSILSAMYRPPVDLLFEGLTFEEAKLTCCTRNLWLLVNLQSRTEFASRTLNRDLWSNDTVSETVMSSFVLWQVYDDTVEGEKMSTFYTIDSAPPVVLVIDPVTGQKMRMWKGVIEAQSFVEDLCRFLEAGPHEHIASLIRNRRPEAEDISWKSDQVPAPCWGEEFEKEDDAPCLFDGKEEENNGLYLPDMIQEPKGECESAQVKEEEEEDTCVVEFPVLTQEPKGDCDVCRLCVRFPDGRRKQRRFLKSQPIQLLWSFCYSQMIESEKKAFKLVQAIPGASKTLDYEEANVTFEQSGLANSMVSITWE